MIIHIHFNIHVRYCKKMKNNDDLYVLCRVVHKDGGDQGLEFCISIIKVSLADHNDVDCCTSKIFTANNDTFPSLIQMIVKFDIIMDDNLRCVQENEIHDYYLELKKKKLFHIIALKMHEGFFLIKNYKNLFEDNYGSRLVFLFSNYLD